MSTLFAFLHHLAAFTLVSALAVEFVLIGQTLSVATAKRLQMADRVLGIAAVTVLVVGMLRVFHFEKGAAYYFQNHAFLTKLAVFLIAAGLSVVPTMEFASWRKAVAAGQAPQVSAQKLRRVKMLIHAQLAAVVIIVLCAALMARGGWI